MVFLTVTKSVEEAGELEYLMGGLHSTEFHRDQAVLYPISKLLLKVV